MFANTHHEWFEKYLIIEISRMEQDFSMKYKNSQILAPRAYFQKFSLKEATLKEKKGCIIFFNKPKITYCTERVL